jgi:Beta/Gamma crystallin
MRTARTHSMWNQARVLGGSAALLLVITLASNAWGTQCLEPPPGQEFEDFYHPFVNVYTGTGHTGTCRTIPRGLTIADLGDPSWGLDNTIRSIKVGRSVRLRLFAGTGFSGDWEWWENSRENLDRWNWNARASSLRVEDRAIRLDCSNLHFNTVAIYEDSDFRGDCRVLSPGCYDRAKEMGFENDSLSSVRNNAGAITLYRHAHFRSPLPPPDSLPCYWPFACVDHEGVSSEYVFM